jgi:hypothetical protein
MENQEKQKIESLLKMDRMTAQDVKDMQQVFNTYIDIKFHICSHCAAQIRAAQISLSNWYNSLEFVNEEIVVLPIIKGDKIKNKIKM